MALLAGVIDSLVVWMKERRKEFERLKEMAKSDAAKRFISMTDSKFKGMIALTDSKFKDMRGNIADIQKSLESVKLPGSSKDTKDTKENILRQLMMLEVYGKDGRPVGKPLEFPIPVPNAEVFSNPVACHNSNSIFRSENKNATNKTNRNSRIKSPEKMKEYKVYFRDRDEDRYRVQLDEREYKVYYK